MLHVRYSNKPEVLLAQLQAQLARDVGAPPRDLFTTTPLIAASRPMAAWVTRALAAQTGLVTHVETWLLRRYIEACVERAFPDAKVLDQEVLRDLLVRRFLADDLDGKALAPVRSYLGAGDRAAQERRAIQLAGQLARTFEEYLYTRPEMLARWSRGEPSPWHGPDDALARWQRTLWRELVDPNGARAQGRGDPARYVLPTQLLEAPPRALCTGEGPVFVFGLSFVGLFYHRALAHLAQAMDVHVYALNPCMEFWEDLKSARGRERLPRRGAAAPRDPADAYQGDDVFALRDGDDNLLLAQWGRPARENIRLLNEATAGNATGTYVDPTHQGRSLLRQLQLDIVQRRPASSLAPRDDSPARDDSIEVIGAPSVARECEAVTARIWRLLEQDPTLRLDEVAVLIADGDPERYVGPLLAAFGEGGAAQALPHQLVGLPHALGSPVTEAARLLLELPTARLTRAEVFRVLAHPLVNGPFDANAQETWAGWLDDLGIVHGADADAHRGTYLEGLDRLHWDQGLRRLALGAFLSADPQGDAPLFAHGAHRDLPSAAGAQLDEGAGALLQLCRSLLADVQALAAAHLTAPAWAEALTALLATYLHPRDDLERRALERCLRVTRALAHRDLGDANLSFTVARELCLEALAGATSSGGGAVTGGVRVGTLQSVRGIPSRTTFVMGLAEGRFPSGAAPDPLDLRPRKPRAGDVSAREKDAYLFLEALLCARDRVILTATDRSESTGEPVSLSPVIALVQAVLERSYLGEPLPVVRVPRVRAHAPADDPRFSPSRAQRAEHALCAVGQAIAAQWAPSAEVRVRDVLAQAGLEADPALDRALRLSPIPHAPEASADLDVRRVTLSQLRGFLREPVQGAARLRLGLWADDGDDPAERSDEVFGLSALTRTALLRQVFLDVLSRHTSPTEAQWRAAYRARAERLEARGRAPLGALAEPEARNALEILCAWAAQIADRDGALGHVRLGAADEGEQVLRALPALSFELALPRAEGQLQRTRPAQRTRVELVGRTGLLCREREALVLLAKDRPPAGAAALGRALDAWLDRVALAAAGEIADAPTSVTLLGTAAAWRAELAPLPADAARAYLSRLLRSALAEPQHLLFPRDVALAWHADGQGSFRAALEKELGRGSSHALDGPVPHIAAFAVPDDDQARARFEAWFGWFTETVAPSADEKRSPARKGKARA